MSTKTLKVLRKCLQKVFVLLVTKKKENWETKIDDVAVKLNENYSDAVKAKQLSKQLEDLEIEKSKAEEDWMIKSEELSWFSNQNLIFKAHIQNSGRASAIAFGVTDISHPTEEGWYGFTYDREAGNVRGFAVNGSPSS